MRQESKHVRFLLAHKMTRVSFGMRQRVELEGGKRKGKNTRVHSNL